MLKSPLRAEWEHLSACASCKSSPTVQCQLTQLCFSPLRPPKSNSRELLLSLWVKEASLAMMVISSYPAPPLWILHVMLQYSTIAKYFAVFPVFVPLFIGGVQRKAYVFKSQPDCSVAQPTEKESTAFSTQLLNFG